MSDNGSDGHLRGPTFVSTFAKVRIVENGANLGFARGNNAGINVAQGEYVLILNPDTIIHDRALEKLVAYADRYPDGGAFGCRVLNPDGSFQNPARPLPTALGAADRRPECPMAWTTICCFRVRPLYGVGRRNRTAGRISVRVLHSGPA